MLLNAVTKELKMKGIRAVEAPIDSCSIDMLWDPFSAVLRPGDAPGAILIFGSRLLNGRSIGF
jgi:hypothetical protein